MVIINTCSFIREAKEESIATILDMAEAKEKGKCQRLVVTGCLPQRYGSKLLQELPEVDLFLGTDEWGRIADLLPQAAKGELHRKQFIARPTHLYDHRTPRLFTSTPGSVYLKIAEGCSNYCSYCVIPQLRGRLRSRKIASVLQEARQAVSRGVKEINLIAQDITAYGRDFGDETDLTRLLRGLVKVKGLRWIRLLYAHPGHVTPELIRLMREEEKICRYLDLPLQHIDDHLLRAMNRSVSGSRVRDLIARLRQEIPGITLRTSLMVGFPGETERRFRRLFDFVKESQFEHLGVFRYSKEEGTAAATLKGQVSVKVKEQRYHQIMRLQRKISLRQQKEKIGSRLAVLVNRAGTSSGVLWEGRTQGQAPEVDGVTFLRRGVPNLGRSSKPSLPMLRLMIYMEILSAPHEPQNFLNVIKGVFIIKIQQWLWNFK